MAHLAIEKSPHQYLSHDYKTFPMKRPRGGDTLLMEAGFSAPIRDPLFAILLLPYQLNVISCGHQSFV